MRQTILMLAGLAYVAGLFLASIYLEQYLLVGFLMAAIGLLPFFLRFEGRKADPREIVLIAVLSAIAGVSRVPFASLPSVQPTSFVIIIAGMAFGAEAGFLVGAAAAFVSNMFLGQGPWTPWQMFSWGMMGLSAGLLKDTFVLKSRMGRWLFGLIWGFLFGWIMNLWFILGVMKEFHWPTVAASMASSFYFDLAHGLSNLFFLAVFGGSCLKVLERLKEKYGLNQR